jgi:hypothetical protein
LRPFAQSEVCEPARGRVEFTPNDIPFQAPTMSLTPNSYSPAAMARVRVGWRRDLHPIGTLPLIAPNRAFTAVAVVVPK